MSANLPRTAVPMSSRVGSFGGVSLRQFTIGLVFAAGLCSASNQAVASIISEASSYGVDTLTLDTNTGLEWLDVPLTQGRSFNDVSAQLGAGGEFAGFRYASNSELQAFMLDFGFSAVPLFFSGLAGDVTAAQNFISMLGQTFSTVIQFGTEGITGDHDFFGIGPPEIDIGNVNIQAPCGFGGPPACATAAAPGAGVGGVAALDYTNTDVGSFLVRTAATTAVPEPASLALLGAGVAALGLVRRKRRGLRLEVMLFWQRSCRHWRQRQPI